MGRRATGDRRPDMRLRVRNRVRRRRMDPKIDETDFVLERSTFPGPKNLGTCALQPRWITEAEMRTPRCEAKYRGYEIKMERRDLCWAVRISPTSPELPIPNRCSFQTITQS